MTIWQSSICLYKQLNLVGEWTLMQFCSYSVFFFKITGVKDKPTSPHMQQLTRNQFQTGGSPALGHAAGVSLLHDDATVSPSRTKCILWQIIKPFLI